MNDIQEITSPINLRADHNAPVRGIPMDALLTANIGSTDSYGADQYTEELHRLLETALGFSVHMALASTGTQANILALDALKYVAHDPGATVITPNMAHIVNHEAGIVAAKTGMGIIRLPSVDGRFQPEILDRQLSHRPDDTVFEQPKIVAITNPTEVGVVWLPEEIKKLADYCHANGLLLFIDGARVWNAAAKIGFTSVPETLKALYQYADAFTIGMIKNGGGLQDLVCVKTSILAQNLWGRLVKQNGAEIAKQRFASAPVLADLQTAEPLEVAGHANRLAAKLTDGLLGLGVKLAWGTETNMVWPLLKPEQKTQIENSILHYEETDETGLGLDSNWFGLVLLRFVTSWTTTDAEIEQAIAILQAVLTDDHT